PQQNDLPCLVQLSFRTVLRPSGLRNLLFPDPAFFFLNQRPRALFSFAAFFFSAFFLRIFLWGSFLFPSRASPLREPKIISWVFFSIFPQTISLDSRLILDSSSLVQPSPV